MRRLVCTLLLAIAVMGAWASPGAEPGVVRVAFLSDTHVNLWTNAMRVMFNRHADEAIAAVNAAQVDLVLVAGDLTDNGKPEQMKLFRKKVKQIKAPVLFVPGNHDVGIAGNAEKKSTITPERVKLFRQQLGPDYFAREAGGVRVVGINSCLFETGFPEEAQQWTFLEKELAKPASKPTLLLEHYPLFIKAVDEPPNSTWNVHPAPRQRLLALLKQGGVKTVLSGHLHRPIIHRLDGILFLSNLATAYGLPEGKQEAGWVLLRVPRAGGEVTFEFQRLE